jgi:hypothetical protein
MYRKAVAGHAMVALLLAIRDGHAMQGFPGGGHVIKGY